MLSVYSPPSALFLDASWPLTACAVESRVEYYKRGQHEAAFVNTKADSSSLLPQAIRLITVAASSAPPIHMGGCCVVCVWHEC